jgi:putative MFS transporter
MFYINLAGLLLIDHPSIGRKRLMAGCLFLSSVSTFCFAFSQNSLVGAVTVVCLFSAFSNAAWGALDCLSSESYPTPLRSSAMGVLSSAGRIGSVLAQFVNAYLMELNIAWLLLVASG